MTNIPWQDREAQRQQEMDRFKKNLVGKTITSAVRGDEILELVLDDRVVLTVRGHMWQDGPLEIELTYKPG